MLTNYAKKLLRVLNSYYSLAFVVSLSVPMYNTQQIKYNKKERNIKENKYLQLQG